MTSDVPITAPIDAPIEVPCKLPYMFYDADRRGHRPQTGVPLDGKRSHPVLRKPGGGIAREESDLRDAMAVFCRGHISAGLLDPKSKMVAYYLGAGAEVVPISMSPRAPPRPRTKSVRKKPVPGWHGMDVVSIEVDHQLVAELTPDGSAVKIGVAPLSAAAKAGLRTGDYVLSLGQSGRMVSLRDFDALGLKAGTGILVQFHRSSLHRRGEFDTKAITLRRLIGANRKTPPWWQSRPKGELGRAVEQGKDRAAFVGQMAAHPHMPMTARNLVARMASYYDGKQGIFPGYAQLAADLGSARRATAIENARCLEWLGVLEIQIGKGRAARTQAGLPRGGFSNRFVLHWPEVWPLSEKT